jgi:phage-related protein
MGHIEVEYYESPAGHCPVSDFLDSLGPKESRKLLWVVDVVESHGFVPQNYLKKLKNSGDLWEVRARSRGRSLRLLGFFVGNRLVLVHGFSKKDQEIPQEEILVASKRQADYLARSEGRP